MIPVEKQKIFVFHIFIHIKCFICLQCHIGSYLPHINVVGIMISL